MNATSRRWSPQTFALVLLLAGGCSSLRGERPDPFQGGARDEAASFVLRIDNATRSDARVQIVWGASAERLGDIRAGEGETFQLPVKGQGFRLQVDFLGAGQGFETPPLSVRDGQFIRYRIPSE